MSDFVSQNNKRLAKNTLFLYVRMIFLMCISLYTSRVILKALGVSDYGLYNVVGGFVTMFGFLNSTLSSSTQRFLNVELGKGNLEKVKKVFSTALLLHVILALIVLFLAETLGLWYVCNILIVEPGREFAAICVYQFSVIAICIQIVQLPFMSTIIAHEKMDIYAYLSIFEGLARLSAILAIQYISGDKLIFYGLFILIVQLLVALIYNAYCHFRFEEARYSIKSEKQLFKEMLGFSGWNVFGNLASVCNSQGINLLLNAFFGTALNAARGIAFQIYSLDNKLISNFQIAVKPQVIKYYANGQLKEMTDLVFNAAKYSALLVSLVNIPIIIEIRPLLHLWLGDYPNYTPIFVRIILLRSIIVSMTGNIIMVVHASGYLKNVGITAGLIQLTVLPISYVFLMNGYSATVPFIINILGALGEAFFELYWMNYYIKFPIVSFYKNVYGRVFLLSLLMFSLPYLVHVLMSDCNEYVRMVTVGVISVLFSLTIIYFGGLTKTMRKEFDNRIIATVKYLCLRNP